MERLGTFLSPTGWAEHTQKVQVLHAQFGYTLVHLWKTYCSCPVPRKSFTRLGVGLKPRPQNQDQTASGRNIWHVFFGTFIINGHACSPLKMQKTSLKTCFCCEIIVWTMRCHCFTSFTSSINFHRWKLKDLGHHGQSHFLAFWCFPNSQLTTKR